MSVASLQAQHTVVSGTVYERLTLARNINTPLPVLHQLLLRDANVWVRWLAALSLGMIADPGSVPALEQALAEDADQGVRWRAVLALRIIGNTASISVLEQVLAQDTDADVRHCAAWALDQIKEKTA